MNNKKIDNMLDVLTLEGILDEEEETKLITEYIEKLEKENERLKKANQSVLDIEKNQSILSVRD